MKIEEKGDIAWSDIPVIESKASNQHLVKNEYIQVVRIIGIKGRKNTTLLQFDDFYIDIQGDYKK